MSIVHTLIGARPPARADETPWTKVRIEHSATEAGSYTADETQNLSPVDTKPAEPQSRDLTFSSAVAEAYFRLVFLDAESNESTPTDPVFDDGTGVDRRASVSDVAALLRARTFNDEADQEGEFTADTRPTAAQVAATIRTSYDEVVARLGQEVDEEDELYPFVRNVVALRAAMAIELSYFPEQADEDRETIYKELKALYDEGLSFLISALPDTGSSAKGFYSLRVVSEVGDLFPTSELIP